MLPVLTFGPVEVSTYVLMVSLAGSLGFWRTYRRALRRPAQAASLFTLTVIAFAAGLLGARGLSLLLNRRSYADRPWWSWLELWDRGGMALYGGMALAALAGLACILWTRLPAWEASDLLVMAWLPCLALARLGCFLNGCCYGTPTTSPLGMVAGGSANAVNFGIPSHPAPLYDAAALVALFGLLSWLHARGARPGRLTLAFLGLYAGFRVFHETLRGDPRSSWSLFGDVAVTFNQVASVALLAIALGAYYVLPAGAGGGAVPAADAPVSPPGARPSRGGTAAG